MTTSSEIALLDALRTTGTVREFTDEPVTDEEIGRVLDAARFAPSGGNRQGWRVVVVRDRQVRSAIGDIYVASAREYFAQSRAGLVSWAALTDQLRERRALAGAEAVDLDAAGSFGAFAQGFAGVPVMLVLLADLRALSSPDRDFGRYSLVGGGSVYPFAWSILLAARSEGLGGVLTTLAIRREPQLKALLHVPDEYAVAAILALGHPVRQVRRLRRAGVGEFTTVDAFDGVPFGED